MAEPKNNAEKKDLIKSEDTKETASSEKKQQDKMSQSEIASDTKHVKGKIQDFYEKYKSEISLTILILYVITLAIATIIELVEH